jgi:two-component system cell cycle response regulator
MSAGALEVLLIEPDPEESRIIRSSLGPSIRMPVRIDREETLQAGLKRLSERRYDAVLLDLSLPEDPGLVAFLRLRDAFPDVAILVLAGPGDEAVGFKAVDLGALDTLAKDDSLAEGLPRRLKYAVERHRLRAELKGLDMLDDLTGLYNRRGFVALATPVLKVARRMKSGVLMVVAEVGGDHWSAPAEEVRAVRAAGNLIRDTFRDSDLTARVERDNFAVLAVNTTDGQAISRRLRDKLTDHNAQARHGGTALALDVGVWSIDTEARPDVGQWLSSARERKTG